MPDLRGAGPNGRFLDADAAVTGEIDLESRQ